MGAVSKISLKVTIGLEDIFKALKMRLSNKKVPSSLDFVH